jgi:1,4-alpha-glucan branching enzyme
MGQKPHTKERKGVMQRSHYIEGRQRMAKAQKQKVTSKEAKAATKKKMAKKPAAKKATVMSVGIKKEYLKSRKTCKVTFRLPRIAATDAKCVCIVGDFNDWNLYATPMKKLKNGNYTVTLELQPGREYQFRYLIDESKWENDWNADKYVKSPYGDSDNSVVVV